MVVDGEGHTIPSMVGKAVALRGGADITPRFAGLRGTHIPYGTYVVNLFRTPLDSRSIPIERRFEVKQPDGLFVVVAPRIPYSLSAGDAQLPIDYEVRGKVVPFEEIETDPMWIRLVPTLGSTPVVDIEVNSLGEFHIYQVLTGRYLALVLRAGKIIDTQEIVFHVSSTGLQRILLKLSNHAPSLGPIPEDIRK